MKYAKWLNPVGQVVLIFIGVTVATWFENWNNDLVENDSLRENIVNLYEGRYSYIGENGKIGHEFSLTVLMPALTRNFTNVVIDVDGPNSNATPVNYAALKKNNEFIEQVRLLASLQKIEMQTNSNLISSIEQVRADIGKEIKRLD